MKCLIVLSALVAFSSASLLAPLAYSSALPLNYGLSSYAAAPFINSYSSVVSPAISYSAPAVAYSAPTVAAYSAPTVVAAPAPAVVAAAPAVVASSAVKTQYHAQDELGQASYGHSEPLQTHNAVQDAFGNKVGSFSYVAPDGRVLRTDYVADGLGYRAASNALPVGPGAGPLPVADTPEVVAARAAHLAAHGRAKRSLLAVGHTPASTAPLATAIVAPRIAAPIAYSAPIATPLTYSSHIAAPLAYSAPIAAPFGYSAHVAAPLAYSAPAVLQREATLTTVVNNPGHAVSYRVD